MLKGCRLRDEDCVRSFVNYIQKKLTGQSARLLASSPESLLELFDEGPLPDLYNVIYALMYPQFSKNEYGYAKTESTNISTKTWLLALDCQSLIICQKKTLSKQ